MPELPEVETVVRGLRRLIEGRTIVSAGLYREKLAPLVTPQRFERTFNKTKVESVKRRGKYILIELDNRTTLLVHLRMSGRFQLFQPANENPKFTHAEFFLDDDSRLVFSDQRHFGYMNLVGSRGVKDTNELKRLAPEPFSEDFSKDYFRYILRSTRRSIKELLLDQTKVCGLGNIYASEALFLTRLHPETKSNDVSTFKSNRLRDNIRLVLKESLDFGSTLKIDPLNLESRYYGGAYEGEWRVYDREGKPCVSCENHVRRIVQSGRSSYFCIRCQKKRCKAGVKPW